MTRAGNFSVMAIEPTTPKGLRTRATILDAARQVFSRIGYVETRMADVVDASKLSMGAVYRYFDNKEDLFAQVIADLHEGLFLASQSTVRIENDTYGALYEANRGYLALYHDNRDLMRAFIESTAMEPRFLHIWWDMRERHVHRFVEVARRLGITEVDGVDARTAAQAMASLVEQSAYAWFAHHSLNDGEVGVDAAARIVTRSWYLTFFGDPVGSLPTLSTRLEAGAP